MGFSSQAGMTILRTQPTAGTFAADLASAGLGIPLRGGALGANREMLVTDPEIGGSRDTKDAYLGAASFSGDYEFYARIDSIATLLNACLGTTASVANSGVTTHTITGSDESQLPFLSIEERIGAGLETFHYTDAVVNTFHLEADANGYLQGTAGVIARLQQAGVTPATDPEIDQTPLYVGTNISLSYGGVTLPAKSFSLDINNNFADDDFRLGSFNLGDLTPGAREITAGFSIREQSSALWRQAVYGASAATTVGGLIQKQQLVINVSAYEVIGATATPYGFSITLPKFALSPYTYAVSGADIIDSDLEGRALRPDLAVPNISVVLKTGRADIA